MIKQNKQGGQSDAREFTAFWTWFRQKMSKSFLFIEKFERESILFLVKTIWLLYFLTFNKIKFALSNIGQKLNKTNLFDQ